MALRISSYLLFALAALVSSCSQPLEHSCFRSVDSLRGWMEEDTINLSLELMESDFPATLRLSAQAKEDAIGQDFTIYLTFVSPDNDFYRDTVTLRFGQSEGGTIRKKGSTIQILWPYLHIDRLNKEGRWQILLQRSNEDKDLYSMISGMGISVSKQTKDR